MMLEPPVAAVGLAAGADSAAGEARTALTEILHPADILLSLDASTKNRALEAIARFVGARHGIAERDVYAALVEREKIGSTGLGYGVAIPHARLRGIVRPVAAYARTEVPIPFDAPDYRPVSDMLILLVPEEATDEHLQLLAEIADLFCDRSFRERLRACRDAEGVHVILTRARSE